MSCKVSSKVKRSILTRAVLSVLACGAVWAAPIAAHASTVTVAVAANFKKAAGEIGAAFTKATGDEVQYAFGATGNFAVQIRNGAPFDVLLAADDTTPRKLADEGLAQADSGFVYARGALVLYSATLPVAADGDRVLRDGRVSHLAVANPKIAPYGAAAMEVIRHLGLADALAPKIVQGANIGQTFDFVGSGNAEAGFVALSQAKSAGHGQWWVVPQADYAPIEQGAILLKPGESNPAAKAYLTFLRGPQAQAVIEKYGYTVPKR